MAQMFYNNVLEQFISHEYLSSKKMDQNALVQQKINWADIKQPKLRYFLIKVGFV